VTPARPVAPQSAPGSAPGDAVDSPDWGDGAGSAPARQPALGRGFKDGRLSRAEKNLCEAKKAEARERLQLAKADVEAFVDAFAEQLEARFPPPTKSRLGRNDLHRLVLERLLSRVDPDEREVLDLSRRLGSQFKDSARDFANLPPFSRQNHTNFRRLEALWADLYRTACPRTLGKERGWVVPPYTVAVAAVAAAVPT
jgi:hypothetical protein